VFYIDKMQVTEALQLYDIGELIKSHNNCLFLPCPKPIENKIFLIFEPLRVGIQSEGDGE
jgi:hypothetical protein